MVFDTLVDLPFASHPKTTQYSPKATYDQNWTHHQLRAPFAMHLPFQLEGTATPPSRDFRSPFPRRRQIPIELLVRFVGGELFSFEWHLCRAWLIVQVQ